MLDYKTALTCPLCLEGTIKIRKDDVHPRHRMEHLRIEFGYSKVPRCTKCGQEFVVRIHEDLSIGIEVP